MDKQKEVIFCISKISLNHEDTSHERIICTIYRKLTGDAHNCPSVGRHWEVIGFQGTDPAQDLRGVGMFGLLQLLYFLSKDTRLPMDIYMASHKFEHVSLKQLYLKCRNFHLHLFHSR